MKEKQLSHNSLFRRVFLWVSVALVIVASIYGMTKLAQTPVSVENVLPASLAVVTENDIVKGNKNADVVLIEYSDFQCPACGSYYPILKQLSLEFENEMLFVYRHFPLRQIHPSAQLAGQVAEAAGKQDKFWEMHDMIFENQRFWSDQSRVKAEETFVSYAEALDLDIEQFKKDFKSKEVIEKVNSDYNGGISAQVNSTPTFFLNGERVQNPRSYEEFRNIIKEAIDSNS